MYKRQVSTDKYYDAIVKSGTFKGLISSFPKVDDVTLDTKEIIEKARKLYDGLTAVSYTHLDVYKRQRQNSTMVEKVQQ